MEPYKLLLIEDDEDIAGFLQLELEHEGYIVTVNGDGRTENRRLCRNGISFYLM